jgi:hypothetical protein
MRRCRAGAQCLAHIFESEEFPMSRNDYLPPEAKKQLLDFNGLFLKALVGVRAARSCAVLCCAVLRALEAYAALCHAPVPPSRARARCAHRAARRQDSAEVKKGLRPLLDVIVRCGG